MTKYRNLSRRIAVFARDRNWDQFRSPKNLAMALSVEAGEVLEHFLWLTQEESTALAPMKRSAIKDEMADVFIYLVRLSDQLGIDLYAAAESKLADNERRFPVEKVRGGARKCRESKA